MGVTLTEKAAGEVKKIMTEQSLPEEAVLREGFGTRHVEYARRVPALIPLVGAR